jgi:hypothetical protein
MAEKQRGERRERTSAERRATAARKAAESDHGLLDNPEVEDEPSEIRHTLYFGAVLGFALLVNVLVMLVAAGGR